MLKKENVKRMFVKVSNLEGLISCTKPNSIIREIPFESIRVEEMEECKYFSKGKVIKAIEDKERELLKELDTVNQRLQEINEEIWIPASTSIVRRESKYKDIYACSLKQDIISIFKKSVELLSEELDVQIETKEQFVEREYIQRRYEFKFLQNNLNESMEEVAEFAKSKLSDAIKEFTKKHSKYNISISFEDFEITDFYDTNYGEDVALEFEVVIKSPNWVVNDNNERFSDEKQWNPDKELSDVLSEFEINPIEDGMTEATYYDC